MERGRREKEGEERGMKKKQEGKTEKLKGKLDIRKSTPYVVLRKCLKLSLEHSPAKYETSWYRYSRLQKFCNKAS